MNRDTIRQINNGPRRGASRGVTQGPRLSTDTLVRVAIRDEKIASAPPLPTIQDVTSGSKQWPQ